MAKNKNRARRNEQQHNTVNQASITKENETKQDEAMENIEAMENNEMEEKNIEQETNSNTIETQNDVQNTATNEAETVEEEPKPKVKKLNEIRTLEELFENYKNDSRLKSFVIHINTFYNKLKGPEKDNPDIIVSAQYSFFNGLIRHLNVNNYGEFKMKLDVLLKALVLGKNTQFNIINIIKFDHFWKYSNKIRIDFYMLMTFLDAIANPKDRRTELKRIKIEKLSNHMPDNIYRHITRYLNI